MKTDAEVMALIDTAFGEAPRPEHFTNYTHCEECAEHDETLRTHDRQSLRVAHVGNPGWDPLCFCSPEGMAYYLPTLARFTLVSVSNDLDWYGVQLVFHLTTGGKYNQFYQSWSPLEREAVYSLLEHLIETRTKEIELHAQDDEFLNAAQLWRAAA